MFHHAEGWVWAGTVILIDRTSCELQFILTTHQYQNDSWQINILTHLHLYRAVEGSDNSVQHSEAAKDQQADPVEDSQGC